MIETAQQVAQHAVQASDRYLFLFSQALIVGGLCYVIKIMFNYLRAQAEKLEKMIADHSALMQKTNSTLDINTQALNTNTDLLKRLNER